MQHISLQFYLNHNEKNLAERSSTVVLKIPLGCDPETVKINSKTETPGEVAM